MHFSDMNVLIIRAQGGDRRASDQIARHLLAKFHPAIARASLVIGKPEAISAAGLSITVALKKVRPGDSVEAFFYACFQSHFMTEARAAARRIRREAEAASFFDERHGDVESEFAIRSRFENATLSKREREIVLSRLRGETFQEIANSLRVSGSAISVAFTRALKKIQVSNELA
jgi:RNA polymerase sigma factor (sigma-70 family)